MGDCKQQMQPTTQKAKTFLEKVKDIRARKKQDIKTPEQAAKTFVDQLAVLDESITSLIDTKKKDLISEKGREKENEGKLARLENIQLLVERIAEQAERYATE